jgi:hypothetical protein
MLEIEGIDGHAYGITFLIGDGRLKDEDKIYLMTEATKMYYTKERKRNLKTENLEGKLTTKRKFELLVCFGGIRFEAEIDSIQTGRTNLRFLVCDLSEEEKAKYN